MEAREAAAPQAWLQEGNAFPFDPRDPVFRANPYPTYNELRETQPVLRSQFGMLVLSKHSDCVELLHHTQTSNDQRNSTVFRAYIEAVGTDPFEGREPSFLFLDPPDHTRLRGLVSHAFTHRRVRDLGPRINEIVDELLDAALPNGGMEVIEELAYLVPVRVICELLGVPTADHEIFKGWSRELARGLDPDFMIPEQTRQSMLVAGEALREYFEKLIVERTKNPGDDMLSALIHAEQEGDKLSHAEVLATLGLLLIAGHETTVNLIGNGILQLSRHPDQYAKLPADPALARGAVEETLRFDPPVQVSGRIAMTELQFGDATLEPGCQGICVLGAANRDPEEFGETADEFDITRVPNNHVAFGAGIHFCLGAPLARLEAQIAFERFAQRVGSFEPTDEPGYRENFVLRGLSRLPVEFKKGR
ncbi:MAG TPA: cytochrome P450 [Actinomycetota bacterium]|jgi:cytochrome P450|nr:cytochrome P450 [Actinomycetota bacterium]